MISWDNRDDTKICDNDFQKMLSDVKEKNDNSFELKLVFVGDCMALSGAGILSIQL